MIFFGDAFFSDFFLTNHTNWSHFIFATMFFKKKVLSGFYQLLLPLFSKQKHKTFVFKTFLFFTYGIGNFFLFFQSAHRICSGFFSHWEFSQLNASIVVFFGCLCCFEEQRMAEWQLFTFWWGFFTLFKIVLGGLIWWKIDVEKFHFDVLLVKFKLELKMEKQRNFW